MTKEEFIKKYGNDELAAEMEQDLNSIVHAIEDGTMLKIVTTNEGSVITSRYNNFEVIGHLDMLKMTMRGKIIDEYKKQ